MTDEKKPDESELSEEQLDDVAGGFTFVPRTPVVADNIAGQTDAVTGAVDGLNAANDLLSQMPGLSDEPQAPEKG